MTKKLFTLLAWVCLCMTTVHAQTVTADRLVGNWQGDELAYEEGSQKMTVGVAVTLQQDGSAGALFSINTDIPMEGQQLGLQLNVTMFGTWALNDNVLSFTEDTTQRKVEVTRIDYMGMSMTDPEQLKMINSMIPKESINEMGQVTGTLTDPQPVKLSDDNTLLYGEEPGALVFRRKQ